MQYIIILHKPYQRRPESIARAREQKSAEPLDSQSPWEWAGSCSLLRTSERNHGVATQG
jgi:hypothetical protein